jgi:hypothetical protein
LAGLGVLGLVTGNPVMAGACFLAASGAGAVSAGASLIDRLGQTVIDGRGVALDVLGLASSIFGGAGAFMALRGGGAALAGGVGRFAVWAGFTTDTIQGVLISLEGLEAISDILDDSTLSRSAKVDAVVRLLGHLALNTGLLVMSAGDLGQIQTRLSGAVGEAAIAVPPAVANRLDLLETRVLASFADATPDELTRLDALSQGQSDEMLGLIEQYGDEVRRELAAGQYANADELRLALEARVGRAGAMTGSPETAGRELESLPAEQDEAYVALVAEFRGVSLEEVGAYYRDLVAQGIDYEALIESGMARYPTLTRAEADAIFGYTTNLFYRDFNRTLDAGGTPEAQHLANLLNSGLESMPPAANVQYRGVRLSSPAAIAAFDAEFARGEIVVTESFWSTGPDPDNAYGGPRSLIIHTNSAKDITEFAFGVHFHEIIGKTPYTSEAIIPPGVRFEVVDVNVDTGTVTLREVP